MTEQTAETPHLPAISLTIHNDLTEFKRIPARLISFLQAHDISTSAAYRARVAVEELVVNVIAYGYDDDNVHTIDIEVRIEGEMIVVRIEDDGRPFDPSRVPRPDLGAAVESRRVGGWGVQLVRSLSKELRYERRGDRNVIRVLIPRTAHKG